MANQRQLKRLQAGISKWNAWRKQHPEESIDLSNARLRMINLNGIPHHGANLSGADLSNANLSGANFRGIPHHGANLSGADLSNTDLTNAELSNANLSNANLSNADLRYVDFLNVDLSNANLSNADLRRVDFLNADLSNANLTSANLIGANLTDAHLNGADLSNATIEWTTFGELDLRKVKGLETVVHQGPSNLTINTLYRSEGDIPEMFVRGTGAPDSFIEYMHALASKPIQYYTCFISYSSKNQDFAQRLYADLQSNGVRCWYAPEDLKWGAQTRQGIDEAIRLHDKLLLILSKQSIASGWVEQEVLTAMKKEKREKRTTLFPVRIDNAIDTCPFAWASEIRRERNIGNFTGWKKSHDSYQKAFKRLLRDLKADTTQQNKQDA